MTDHTFTDSERAAVYRAIAERRDMRHFCGGTVAPELLARLLEARGAGLPPAQLAALFGPALMADLEAECGAEVAAQFAIEAGLAAPA